MGALLGCGGRGAATSPKTPVGQTPKSPSEPGTGLPTEAECSALFNHAVDVIARDESGGDENKAWFYRQQIEHLRLEFVVACRDRFEREDVDCTRSAASQADLDACNVRHADREPRPAPPATALTCEKADADALGGPRIVTAAQFADRYGATATKFSDAPTTKAQPLETCGIIQGQLWLGHLTCDDGSNPFHKVIDVEDARAGSVGAGGRCGTIIDLYQVACPEKTWDVYVDAYFCLPHAWEVLEVHRS